MKLNSNELTFMVKTTKYNTHETEGFYSNLMDLMETGYLEVRVHKLKFENTMSTQQIQKMRETKRYNASFKVALNVNFNSKVLNF